MVVLINRLNLFFDEEKAKSFYEENYKYLDNNVSFEHAFSDWYFNIYDKGDFIGCIYVSLENHNNKEYPFYSGFAVRKKAKQTREAVKILLDLLFQHYDTICTYTENKWARFFNSSIGLKHFNKNIYYITKKEFYGKERR